MNKPSFCPDCATPLVAAEHGGMTRLACSAPDCAYVHWDNPTPVVAAVTMASITPVWKAWGTSTN